VAVVAVAALVALGAVGYVAFRHVQPLLAGSGCEVRTHGQVYKLNASQAGIAATIAGVASHRALPNRAVTIAYAAALQESKLQDLRYGDRDSVGVFQQRPSEGWGSARALMDPVYASTRFFEALVGVHGYLRLPVYKAAQAVQRSADGTAYVQYTPTAAGLSRGFSGHVPRSVWCWYTAQPKQKARLAAARRGLGGGGLGGLARQAVRVHRGPYRRVPLAGGEGRERLDPQPGQGAAGYGRGRLIICELGRHPAWHGAELRPDPGPGRLGPTRPGKRDTRRAGRHTQARRPARCVPPAARRRAN
jgi:hypothetical protein